MVFSLLILTAAFAAVTAQKPKCLITAPSIVHLGVEETVTVQLHGATKPVTIMLYFRLQKGSKRLSEMKTIVLNDQNDYQSVVKLRVDPRLYDKPQRVPYVQLVASGEDVFQKPQPININLSAKNGFLFIQTDKPIYNPGETAKFRVFTLDNYMLPIDEIINVQIFNAKGLKVHSHNLRSGHVLSRSVVLPDVEPAGHWKILAFFVKYPMSNSSVEFEVREYVLPSFEVKIEAPRPYHTLRNQAFQFRVTARYTYGQGVSGTAYARFGLTDEKGDRTFLPGIEKQTQISDGAADMTLATAELQAAAESRGIPHIERMTLYIAVTVLEKASGDLEDAESTSVRIVTSPYIIDLSRTKEYFSPEGMFSILATTTHPDGSRVPALTMRASVTVHLQGSAPKTLSVKGFGDAKGDAVLSFEVPKLATSMDIMVFAESEQEEVILSDAKMTANAVTATYGSYLSIEVQPHVLLPKQALTISFRDITPPGAGRPSHIYYMILSKGRVIQVSRVETHDLTSVSLPYSTDLVPSLRIVAYYYVEQQGDTSIVTDSVWIDVKDACRGQVEIASLRDHKPAEVMKVVVQSDPASKVALVAVDKAVYILNNQNKLTPRKMFDRMDSYDLACSVGGGEDHKSVFQDAGLTFLCNCEIAAGNLEVCNRKRTREKRDLHQEISRIVNRYWNPDRRCCSDGAKPAPLKRSCHDRHKRTAHQTPRCRETFLKCCLEATEVRKRYSKSRRVSLGRVLSSEMENALDEASIHIRSFFPQSWMWVVLDTDPSGHVRYDTAVPDSITTWEVQAVSLSPTTGFCVAEPKELRVFQDFFVSVKLPYSVKKNEQLEVKAIVYNYKEEELQVTVEMEKVEGLCSAGGGAVKEEITVPGNSARSVYFIVVPLVIGNIPITVLARSSLDVQDKIQKELQVVGEGEIVHLQSEFSINAEANAKLEIEIADPLDEVPGRHSTTTMSIRGGVMGESVDNCLNLEGIDKLIQLPTGCAEQTMVKMSPAVHSTRYLDATDQWLPLKAERRDEAIHMVQAGYNTVLTHKKPDGSYGAFLSTPSSVWLTAFIAKELTESRDLINVEDSYIQESVSYLISKQTSSGAFNDPNPLYDRNMKGGIGVSEGDVPLTAFILISMKHALQTYDSDANTAVLQAMAKASSYLEKKLMTLQDAFGLAITAYALSLTNSRAASTAHSMLWQMATCDEGKGTCHWVVGKKADASTGLADSISVETTAYGLLLALTVDDKEMATSIAKWLTEQRKFGGGFRSTQDTVVALEALAKFSTQSNDVEYLDLHIEMCLQDGHKETINLTRSNALTQTAVEVRQGGKVSIRVEGKGNGTLSILQSYRSLKKPDLYCDHLHIEVSVTGDVQYGESEDTEPELDDYYNYDTAEDIQRDEPSHRMAWFDLQSRRKRQAPLEPEKEESLTYTVCLGMKMGESTGMMMVDISLLSGLTPIIQDLEDITKGTEKYIDNYGVDHNKVYLYFHKITDQIECLQFRAKQIVPMGLVQPAAAVIYEYYNPERRCGVFYGAPAQTNMISKLCDGDVCTCAEGHCPKPKVTFSKNMDHTTRNKFACYSPVVNYVYTMEVLNNTDDGVFQYYKTLVTEVLQTGKDAAIQKNAVRTMIQRKACSELTINIGAQYLIMGKDESVSGADRDFRYIMDNKMWIEEIPAEGKCKATKSRKACNLLHDFISQYLLKHCA